MDHFRDSVVALIAEGINNSGTKRKELENKN
jgi:hypothetical protein